MKEGLKCLLFCCLIIAKYCNIKIFIELHKYKANDSYYVKKVMRMKKEKFLKFSKEGLFNNSILQQYDEQTQRFLLGFIMITEEFKIEK